MNRPAGRVGSGRVGELVNFSGSGRVTPFPGRVGSQNLDPRATLPIIRFTVEITLL